MGAGTERRRVHRWTLGYDGGPQHHYAPRSAGKLECFCLYVWPVMTSLQATFISMFLHAWPALVQVVAMIKELLETRIRPAVQVRAGQGRAVGAQRRGHGAGGSSGGCSCAGEGEARQGRAEEVQR